MLNEIDCCCALVGYPRMKNQVRNVRFIEIMIEVGRYFVLFRVEGEEEMRSE